MHAALRIIKQGWKDWTHKQPRPDGSQPEKRLARGEKIDNEQADDYTAEIHPQGFLRL